MFYFINSDLQNTKSNRQAAADNCIKQYLDIDKKIFPGNIQ